MGWYSHIIIAVSMAFFHFGGRRALRAGIPGAGVNKGKATRVDTSDGTLKPTPTWKVQPPSPIEPPPQPRDEIDPKDLKWVRHALEGQQQSGQEADGMGGGAGFVDSVVRGAETPGLDMSRSGSPGL